MIYNAYAEQKEQLDGVQLVSCGHIFAEPDRQILRPRGRQDWLLFYIVSGEELFHLPRPVLGRAGDFVLYAPGEKQHHQCVGPRTGEFYYVHFTCPALPRGCALHSSHLYHLPLNRTYCEAFEHILEDTLTKPAFYERSALYRLLLLLTELEREVAHRALPAKEYTTRIGRAVHHMNRYYDAPLSLEEYAAMCQMSKYHFLRVFAQTVGVSPVEYRNRIRLEQAAFLLQNEELSVEEIGRSTGYTSAAYFSSAFKKQYGLSPKQYQQKHKKET